MYPIKVLNIKSWDGAHSFIQQTSPFYNRVSEHLFWFSYKATNSVIMGRATWTSILLLLKLRIDLMFWKSGGPVNPQLKKYVCACTPCTPCSYPSDMATKVNNWMLLKDKVEAASIDTLIFTAYQFLYIQQFVVYLTKGKTIIIYLYHCVMTLTLITYVTFSNVHLSCFVGSWYMQNVPRLSH